jgi:hypothetical protein
MVPNQINAMIERFRAYIARLKVEAGTIPLAGADGQYRWFRFPLVR